MTPISKKLILTQIHFFNLQRNNTIFFCGVGVITSENVGYIAEIFSFVGAKTKKTFRELSKIDSPVQLHDRNARQEPAWAEGQPLISL